MMKKLILIISFVACVLLVLYRAYQPLDKNIKDSETTSIEQIQQTTLLSDTTMESEITTNQVTAYNYKLYYGTWKIEYLLQTEFRNNPLISHEELIGSELTMNHEQVILNGQVLTNIPMYHITIIPENPIEYMESFPELDHLEFDDEYFMYVAVGLDHSVDAPISIAYGFFVKDDTTLYLIDNNSCYKLSRISHMENYESLVNSSSLILEANNIDEPQFRDTEYKLYYGTWIVDSVVEVNSDFESENKNEKIFDKELIGSEITMERKQILFNDRILSRKPKYSIAIIPNNLESYVEDLPSHVELGLDKPYYVYVTVGTSDLSMELEMPYSFFIKDDTTLYMLYNNCFYKLSRKEHIDDYELEYHAI